MNDYQLSQKALESAFRVHSALGPGLLESAYQFCLVYDLKKSGLNIEVEKKLPINYLGVELEGGYRIDILVEKRLVIEVKSVEALAPIHLAQAITYLKFADIQYGLLINFNVTSLRLGIKRVARGNRRPDYEE